MKHTKNSRYAVAALAALAMGAGFANAANSFYAPGDLLLFFQQEGGTNTVYVNLGNATTYRGSEAGPAGTQPVLNIVDLSSTLTTAFGAGWASDATVYAGLAGVWSSSNVGNQLQDQDPKRTIYVSQSRSSLGNIFSQNTAGYTVNTDGGMTTGSSAITQMGLAFENNYDATVAISEVGVSQIDDQNPFLAPGIQDTAFGIFGGGVQQQGTAGTLGAVGFGGIGQVEFALDLYRIAAKTGISGQVDGPVRQGTYEGSFLINSDGMVSYIPEPSSAVLLGLAGGALVFRRRRA